jgi:D-alanine--poly(phosphoribitol) ligase subunit 1
MPKSDAIDAFLAAAAAKASHTAITLHGQSWSYAELERRARGFAAAYAQLSAKAVMVALPQSLDAYAAMLGAGLAGCFYAPLNLDVPLAKLRLIAGQMQPDLIVAKPELGAGLAQAAPQSHYVDPGTPLDGQFAGRGTRHELAYVIFTSGTTGQPKGVMIPRTALNHYIGWVRSSGFIAATDRVAQFSNIAFDVSVTDIYGSFSQGATLFPVVGRAARMFPARMVARERLTVWNSTPSVISLMMQAGELKGDLLKSLRLINLCGEPLLPAHVSAIFAALPDTILQNSYGPTETTVTMTELRLNPQNFGAACRSSVSIGAAIEGMEMHLNGGAHADEGEIVITGPQLAAGYWQDAERTAAAFRDIDVGGKAVRAYFSGDWAERHAGYLFFKERIDLQVKIHGFRLELDEVARAIHDQGYPVTCVFKWRDELAAVIECPPGKDFDEGALRAGLAKKLEAHAVPYIIKRIEQMPRTDNHKLDRRAVAMWLDAADGGAAASPVP